MWYNRFVLNNFSQTNSNNTHWVSFGGTRYLATVRNSIVLFFNPWILRLWAYDIFLKSKLSRFYIFCIYFSLLCVFFFIKETLQEIENFPQEFRPVSPGISSKFPTHNLKCQNRHKFWTNSWWNRSEFLRKIFDFL